MDIKLVLQYIKSSDMRENLWLDKKKRFMFFRNCKCGQKSVWQGLRKRVVAFSKPKMYSRLRETLDETMVKDSFKFTIVRNPWDRLVSSFFFLRKYNIPWTKQPFQKFVKSVFRSRGVILEPHLHKQFGSAFIGDKQFVDFIGRIENIVVDWNHVSSMINVKKELPHMNKSPHKPYYEYYDDESIEIVRNIYHEDVSLFDYSFLPEDG